MFSADDDDDEYDLNGLYVNGHWEWSNKERQLVFKMEPPLIEDSMQAVTGPVKFKDDIDLLEQQRFKKRFQRISEGEDDVVTLQDVKDIVLYTAPEALLSPTLINLLHMSTTERFIRALILYIQYFLQVSDEMVKRDAERSTKIRTSTSDDIEKEFLENLQDLRLLITKEYCVMILGGSDFKRYHHMGASKKMPSATRKDAIAFESLLQICIQIVWLALSRTCHSKIEAEVHRLFKSQRFNIGSRMNPTDSVEIMSTEMHSVIVGDCVDSHKYWMQFHSPLFDVSKCSRPVDYRIYGLGTIRQHHLGERLIYMERALTMPEKDFKTFKMNLGVIGMSRKGFDIMLREIKLPVTGSSSSRFNSGRASSTKPRGSSISKKSATTDSIEKLLIYPDLVIPPKDCTEVDLPKKFISEVRFPLRIGEEHKLKWLVRVARLQAAKRQRRAQALIKGS